MVGTMVAGIMGLRSPSKFRPILVLGSLIITGCGDQGALPFWAFQHASVQSVDGVLTGFQVWEFYGERWKRKQKEKHHQCALVQSIVGESDVLEGCEDCDAVFAIELATVETDCGAGVNPTDFEGITHFGFGEVPQAISADNPYPAASLGWFISWDEDAVDDQGYAWNALVEEGPDFETGWVEGEEFVLWSAYAWQLCSWGPSGQGGS